MYSQGGKRRAIHLLIFAPDTEIANSITKYLGSKGRLDYDGRPIFGMSSQQLVKDLKEIEEKIEIIPAHCMTPWFGLFGSKSGFATRAKAVAAAKARSRRFGTVESPRDRNENLRALEDAMR